MIAVLVLTVIGWIAAPALRIDVNIVALLGLLATVLTGIFDQRAFQELDWNYLIFYGVIIGISGLMVSLGLDRVAAEFIGALLRRIGTHPVIVILGLAGLTFLLNLILSQQTSVLVLAVAFIPVAPGIGIEPWVIIITILATSSMWFLPTQTTSYLVAYSASEGRLFSHTQARRAAFIFAIVVLAGLALSALYWQYLGLL